MPASEPREQAGGFTLLEVLAAALVAAVLLAATLPSLELVRVFARKVETRARFAQWTLAFEHYRGDRGVYPPVDVSGLLDVERVRAALTGRDAAGAPLTGPALLGNVRRALYLTFAPGEWHPPAAGVPEEIHDAFGNSRIGILVDRDGDGEIRGAELQLQPLAAGNAREGFRAAQPLPVGTAPDGRIPAAVAFYSAGRGREIQDYVFSWR